MLFDIVWLLCGTVERREQDCLPASALAEHCDVLLKFATLLHMSNIR